MNKNQKLYLYSSLFIAIAINSPKLVALDSTSFVATFWHFDLAEFLFQTLLNLAFCMAMFSYNHSRFAMLFSRWQASRLLPYFAINGLLLLAFGLSGILVQRLFFTYGVLPGSGYFVRFMISMALMATELRIIMLMQQARSGEIENEQLRNSFLDAQLRALKAQMNPHFFYNVLSSLSGIVSENPALAQKYIGHMSRMFRYSLRDGAQNMATVGAELTALSSYIELMKMRHENGLSINIDVDEIHHQTAIPHMSLQPLVENALKHNIVSTSRPLHVRISVEDNYLVVSNNIQLFIAADNNTGIGLANLNERYRLLLDREIEIIKTNTHFYVKLPLV
jgi:two-component system, LytTR family, sensor kinase